MQVDNKTSSASSPRQYGSVLICFSSLLSCRPEANLKYWNGHFHNSNLCVFLKLNGSGGCSLILAMVIRLPPCCVLSLLVDWRLLNVIEYTGTIHNNPSNCATAANIFALVALITSNKHSNVVHVQTCTQLLSHATKPGFTPALKVTSNSYYLSQSISGLKRSGKSVQSCLQTLFSAQSA